ESMAPEFPQGLVNRSALILPVELAEQSPAFGRDTIRAAHDQLQLNTAPLARRQTAKVGTAIQQVGIGAEPRRQPRRQHRCQLRWLTQQRKARQARVEGKLGRLQRYVRSVCQQSFRTPRDPGRFSRHGTSAVLWFEDTKAFVQHGLNFFSPAGSWATGDVGSELEANGGLIERQVGHA